MRCRTCGSELDRPGDFCLVCRSSNTEDIAVVGGRERTTVYTGMEGEVTGERTITTSPEEAEGEGKNEFRNYVGLVADEIHRKRPDKIYYRGNRRVAEELRLETHVEVVSFPETSSVDEVFSDSENGLEEVDIPPGEKLGGSHTTLIGEDVGKRAVELVASDGYVKKIIPGPISSGGGGSAGGSGAKVTRSDSNGNLRLLLRDGSTVQENRVVTTASNREEGEYVRKCVNESLDSEDLLGT
ncbi:MAG: DUF2103 domain-containing protein [Halobacteria archaeon]